MSSRLQQHCISPRRPNGAAEAGGVPPYHSSMYQLNYYDLSIIIHTFIMISKANLKFAILNKMNDPSVSFINPPLDADPLNSDL